MKNVGVAVRDLEGNFRPLNDILTDLSKKWSTMTETQKISTAQVVAGTHRYNDFISLLENFGIATESTATAFNSVGSATRENEIYLDSIQGRYQTLSTTMEEFWINFINSDLVKGGISALQTLANVLNGLQNTFGSLGMIVGTSTFAFGMFSTSIKTLATDLAQKKTTLGGLSEAIQKFKTTLADTSTGMNVMQRTTKATGDAFNTLGIASSLAQVKVMALQAVLSMGLSLAITAIVSAVGKLVDSFTTAEERMDAINEKSQALASSIQSTEMAGSDLDRYAEINEKLKQATLSEQERNELNQELLSLKQSLSSLDAEASAILSNDNVSYQEQLDILKQINEEKMREKAEELDKQLGNGFWYQDESKNAEGAKGNIERSVEVLQQLEKLNGKSGMVTTSDGGNLFVEASEIENYIREHTELIEKENIVLQRYNSNVELMKKVNYETDRSIINLSDSTQKYLDNMNKSTQAVDENTQAKKENASVPTGGTVDNGNTGATQTSASLGDYSKAVSELQEYYNMLNEVNEAGAITPEILSKLASNDAYAGLGASATDFASVQKYINDLIVEQEQTANQAYASMLENDTNYYQNKLLLDENWVATFRQHLQDMGMSADEANNYDLSQYTTLQELKTGVMNQFGDGIANWLSQYIDISASGYDIDFRNFKSASEAKLAVLDALNKEIAKVSGNIVTQSMNVSRINTMSKYSDNPLLDKINSSYQKEWDRLKELNTAVEQVNTKLPDFAPSLNLGGVGSIGTGGVKFNNGGLGGSGSGSKGSGGKSATEKEVADLENLVEKYFDVDNALSVVNNKLEENQALMETKEGLERLKYLEKEIVLLNQQKKALENSKKARQNELNSLKKQLQQRNFTFDANGNISNYVSRVTYLQNWVNGQSGETKEKNKEAVEYTMELIEEYTKLLNDEIPSIANEINGVVNEIANVNDEMEELYQERLDVVANYESDVADMIQKTAEKKIEAEKEALEVALESDRKRIESKKKALEEEQELYNKEYEEENYQATLNEERNKLLDIQAEIDKLQYDTSQAGQQKLRELTLEYENQMKVINDMIRENQNQSINDRFEEEQELLDKELENNEALYDTQIEALDKKLEEFLDPINMTNIVGEAMKNGFVDILGETVKVNDAMKQMMAESTIGMVNLNQQYNEWYENLQLIKWAMNDIGLYMNGAGLKQTLDINSIPKNNYDKPVNIEMGGLVINGDVNKDTLKDVQSMLDKQKSDIVKLINKSLGKK